LTKEKSQYEGQDYWIKTFEFQVRSDGWKKRVLNRGHRCRDTVAGSGWIELVDDNGNYFSQPSLLDENGDVTTPDAPYFKEFEVYKKMNFASLNIDLGL